jgi:septal ring factor EnvC (AmiA/AmiB activator)
MRRRHFRRILQTKGFDMKNLALLTMIACGLCLAAVSASARDYDYSNRGTYAFLNWDRLDSQINHLNRMRGHVRWELGNYRAGRQIRREFDRVSREIDHVNSEFKHSDYDRRRLRRKVERLHADLHQIEQQLHVRSRDYYLWR